MSVDDGLAISAGARPLDLKQCACGICTLLQVITICLIETGMLLKFQARKGHSRPFEDIAVDGRLASLVLLDQSQHGFSLVTKPNHTENSDQHSRVRVES